MTRTISKVAPAKLNLTLEVLRRRDDGYHDIKSVVAKLMFGDRVVVAENAYRRVEIHSHMESWKAEQSLVSQAIRKLHEETGTRFGVTVTVRKKIPLVSGLGGDSSCAAATMTAINELFGLGIGHQRMSELAAALGADVPLFLTKMHALMEGKGDIIWSVPFIRRHEVVLAFPQVRVPDEKTKTLYSLIRGFDLTEGNSTSLALRHAESFGSINPALLFNVFESLALDVYPGIEGYIKRMHAAGAANVHLAGAGPTLYSLEPYFGSARNLARRLRQAGMPAVHTSTLQFGTGPATVA